MLDVVFFKCLIKLQFFVILCDDFGMLNKVDVYVNFKKLEVVEIIVGFFVLDNVIIGGVVQVKIVVWVLEIMCMGDIEVGEFDGVNIDGFEDQFNEVVGDVVIELVSDGESVGIVEIIDSGYDIGYEMVEVV